MGGGGRVIGRSGGRGRKGDREEWWEGEEGTIGRSGGRGRKGQ